jgi:hypothetical protein
MPVLHGCLARRTVRTQGLSSGDGPWPSAVPWRPRWPVAVVQAAHAERSAGLSLSAAAALLLLLLLLPVLGAAATIGAGAATLHVTGAIGRGQLAWAFGR